LILSILLIAPEIVCVSRHRNKQGGMYKFEPIPELETYLARFPSRLLCTSYKTFLRICIARRKLGRCFSNSCGDSLLSTSNDRLPFA